jgi:hypothetical protein
LWRQTNFGDRKFKPAETFDEIDQSRVAQEASARLRRADGRAGEVASGPREGVRLPADSSHGAGSDT